MPYYPRDPNLHKNHRSRLRKSAMDNGIDSLNDHVFLELLLFQSIPRVDTNEIAHTAINACGGLSSLFSADTDTITSLPRLGVNSAVLIKTLDALAGRYLELRNSEGHTISTPADAKAEADKFFHKNQTYTLVVFSLDSKCRLIRTRIFHEGNETPQGKSLNVMREAMASYASSVIVAYSHPGSFSSPSPDDAVFIKDLGSRLYNKRILFLETVIYTDNHTFLMSEHPSSIKSCLAFSAKNTGSNA